MIHQCEWQWSTRLFFFFFKNTKNQTGCFFPCKEDWIINLIRDFRRLCPRKIFCTFLNYRHSGEVKRNKESENKSVNRVVLRTTGRSTLAIVCSLLQFFFLHWIRKKLLLSSTRTRLRTRKKIYGTLIVARKLSSAVVSVFFHLLTATFSDYSSENLNIGKVFLCGSLDGLAKMQYLKKCNIYVDTYGAALRF